MQVCDDEYQAGRLGERKEVVQREETCWCHDSPIYIQDDMSIVDSK